MFRSCAFLLAFVSLYPSVLAQAPQEELQHEVTVTLKLIQVFVTDKKGNPVKDLTKEDFIVHEYLTSDRERLKHTVKNLIRIPGFRSLSMYDALGQILYREYFIQDMKDLASAFRIIPGTKNVILFSHGILFHSLYKEIQSNYEEMCDDMAHAGASIFTIDTAGLRGARDQLLIKLTGLCDLQILFNKIKLLLRWR